jgi:stalled ribosome alternative rescue factor ArfA
MTKKVIVSGEGPTKRNPVAASLRGFRSSTVRARKGAGSYRREKRVRED